MKMSQAILYIQTFLLFLTVLLQPSSSLVLHPRLPMYTVLNVIISSPILLKIQLSSEGLPITYLVTEDKRSLVIKLKISSERSVLINGKVNHTSITKTLRNDDTRPSRMLPTVFLIVLAHQHTYGYFAYSMSVTYLIIIQYVYRHCTINKLQGSTVDISPLLHFFWECV
jgi:hypothetical protein